MAVDCDWDDSEGPLLHHSLASFTRWMLRAFWRLKVRGLEHLPIEGAVIVACNHVSLVDPPLLGAAAFPLRSLRYLAKKELFCVPLLGGFLRRLGVIPLDRHRGDLGAVRAAIEVLSRGRSLAIFPEGTRSKDGRPGRPKAGVGFLAGKTRVQVVPARVVNTERFLRFQRLEVRFGPPFRFSGDPSDRGQCREFAHLVMDRIFSL